MHATSSPLRSLIARSAYAALLALTGCAHQSAPPESAPEPGEREAPQDMSWASALRPSSGTGSLPRFGAVLATTQGISSITSLRAAYPNVGAAPIADARRTSSKAFRAIADQLALTAPEKERVAAQGFMVSERLVYPHYAAALIDIYHRELPLFVSADMILHALHASFDALLMTLERDVLAPQLSALLDASHTALRQMSPGGDETLSEAWRDADVFLSVARSLLAEAPVPTLAGGASDELTRDLVAAATQVHDGPRFANQTIDFSQFTLRGHYENDWLLSKYFRAMMWLGRVDLRFLVKAQPSEGWTLDRRALETALFLRDALISSAQRDTWQGLDRIVTLFVGPPDYIRLADLDRLVAKHLAMPGRDASKNAAAFVASLDRARADKLVDELAAGAYGGQRIDGHGVASDITSSTSSELPPSFAFFGQRYVIDSEVMSNLVYDRIVHAGAKVPRRLPDALDVAFALGDDHALSHLEDQLTAMPYAPELAAGRALIDQAPASYWSDSLYGGWLGALRTLAAGARDPRMPAVFRTAAWRDRLLTTELASWAELRHDTLLYAKQSYTATIACDFPAGLVEPYPAFFKSLEAWATRASDVIAPLTFTGRERVVGFLDRWQQTMARLAVMADKTLTRSPHDAAESAFLRDTLETHVEGGMHCGPAPLILDGWYPSLFWNADDAKTFAPTIADIHTNLNVDAPLGPPAVRHVATGFINLLVLSDAACDGTCAFVGPVGSFHQIDSQGVVRFPDSTWSGMLTGKDALPARPAFTTSYYVGEPTRPARYGTASSPLPK